MFNGVNRFKCCPRLRFGVVSSGEFLVYGVREGERVELLGPGDVSSRNFRREFRRHDFTELEVVAQEDTDYTVELIELSDGVEKLDHTPVAVPVDSGPPTLREQVRELVRHELSRAAAQGGWETFEESDDFDIPDDEDLPLTPYEMQEMADDVLDSFDEPESSPPPSEGAAPGPSQDAGRPASSPPGSSESASGAPGGGPTP